MAIGMPRFPRSASKHARAHARAARLPQAQPGVLAADWLVGVIVRSWFGGFRTGRGDGGSSRPAPACAGLRVQGGAKSYEYEYEYEYSYGILYVPPPTLTSARERARPPARHQPWLPAPANLALRRLKPESRRSQLWSSPFHPVSLPSTFQESFTLAL